MRERAATSPESPSPHLSELLQGALSQQAVSLTTPHKYIDIGSPAERHCIHAVCGLTRRALDTWLWPHRAGPCCLPFLGAPWGDGSPPRASLLEQTEVTVGTALRSVSRRGKQQAAKHIPVLLLAPCPQPWHAGGSGGHSPSAATSLLPARPPGMSPAAVSHCPF